MKYKSICCVCLRETPEAEYIGELRALKKTLGFIELQLYANDYLRSINFCPICAKKPITVEQLKYVGNNSRWSY